MTNCNEIQTCVGLAQLRQRCYTCHNDTLAEGEFVSLQDQHRFLLWQAYLDDLARNLQPIIVYS